MAELQTERSFVVELTPEGVQEIQSHKNIYTEVTKPIPLSGREWSTKNYITLWTGILVSIPVYMMASALLSAGLTWYQALFICGVSFCPGNFPGLFYYCRLHHSCRARTIADGLLITPSIGVPILRWSARMVCGPM